MPHNFRKQELIRGKILYYLALIFPKAATLALLQGELDILGYAVPLDELNYHLAYLADKEMVTIESAHGGRGPQGHPKVTLVKITARGIDYYEGRLPAEEGIYLEPRL